MATKPISNFSASWNESKTYSGIGLHVTDTAGTSQSKLLNLTINGQSKFSVDKVGSVVTTFISASHVTASGVKINTFNTNKIITNTISASYLSASVFITSNFSPNKVTATNVSASYITASGLKISTFSPDKIVSTRISASYLSASSIRTGNFSPSKVTATNISASYISASNVIVGKFPTGKRILFSDQSKPSFITNKLRTFSASISYLEMMSGSDAKILFPEGKLLIGSKNSGSGFILDDQGRFWFTDSFTASLSGNNCDKPSTISEFSDNLGRRPTYIKGSPNKRSPKDESINRGFSIGNACGEYITINSDPVTKCINSTYNNFDVSSQFTEQEINALPAWARKNIYSGSNTYQISICIDGCKTKFTEKVVGNSNFRIYPISHKTTEFNSCTSGCLDIKTNQKVLGSERERDHSSFCWDAPTSKVGNKSNIKVAARSLLANDEQSLYTVKVEDYNDTTDDLKNKITASAVGGNYAAAAENLGYSIPLPSYAEVSSSVYDIKYTLYPKSVKDNWNTSTGTNFYVDAVDIQSGSFIQGIGPNGNKLRISADKITANTLSASNFSVSGGLIKIGKNSLYLSSSNSFSRIYGTGLTVSASYVSASRINVHTASFTNVEIITLNTSEISASYISASRMIVGGPVETDQYEFLDGSKPDLYTNKLRAHSASFTNLEIISGSDASIKIVNNKGAVIFQTTATGNNALTTIGDSLAVYMQGKVGSFGVTDWFELGEYNKNTIIFSGSDIIYNNCTCSISGNIDFSGRAKFGGYGKGSLTSSVTIWGKDKDGVLTGIQVTSASIKLNKVTADYKNCEINSTFPVYTIIGGSTNVTQHSISVGSGKLNIDGDTRKISVDQNFGQMFFDFGKSLIKTGTRSLYITGSLISGSKFRIHTPDTGSSINIFNVTASVGNFKQLTSSKMLVNAFTASTSITASSAGASSGKYMKVKIGNKTYKMLLYEDI